MIPLSYCVYLLLCAEINRRKSLNYVLPRSCKVQINRIMRGECPPGRRVKMLGCMGSEYRQHVESSFFPGMTWENYGAGAGGWYIEFLRPCDGFDLEDPAQQNLCFHYTNTTPIWNVHRPEKVCVPEAAESPEVVEARRQAYSLDKLTYAS